MEKKSTRWNLRIPPSKFVTLRDGTIVRNTSPTKNAHLQIESKIDFKSKEQSDDPKKAS